MRQTINSIIRSSDTIVLEGKHSFSAYVTIGLMDSNNFSIEIEFTNLNMDEVKILGDLYKLDKCLKIDSKIIDSQKYNITHIIVKDVHVVKDFSSNNKAEITWKCFSDDPQKSNSLIIE